MAGETGLIQITSTDRPWGLDAERVAEERRRREEARAEERRLQQAARAAERRRQAEARRSRRAARSRGVAAWFGIGGLWGQEPETDEWLGETTGGETIGGVDFSLGGSHFFPATFITLGFEIRGATMGWEPAYDDDEGGSMRWWQVSGAPTLGLEVPFVQNRVRIFAHVFLEGGYFGPWHGLITDWATPGFEVGIRGGGFGLRYRQVMFSEGPLHFVGLMWGGL